MGEADLVAASKQTTIVLLAVGTVLAGSVAGAGVALFGPAGSGSGVPVSAASRTATPTPKVPAGSLDPDPVVAARAVGSAYLDAWEKSDWPTMQAQLDSSGGNVERALGGMTTRLGVTRVVTTPGQVSLDGKTMSFSVVLSLRDLGDLSYDSELVISRAAVPSATGTATAAGASAGAGTGTGPAKVRFTAKSVYPTLGLGQRLDLVASADARGKLLDRKGRSLAGQADLVANVLGRYDAKTGKATGLERVVAERIGDSAKRTVAVVEAESGAVVEEVKTFPGVAEPADVRTTLDLTYQKAATKALAGTKAKAALVAIDVQTGEVRAAANRPWTGIPPATSGQYPPGSTFKIVTALAALRNGKTPTSAVQCPTTITAFGKVFRNHEKAPNRTMPLTEAFADSCNTAFIGLARGLPDGELAAAAEDLGFNVEDPLPVASFGGSYPTPKDGAELAASAIGQGRVQASPLQMAGVAAAVASGTYHQPRLLADCADCTSKSLPEAARIRPMMRAVVTSGTGTASRGVPGGAVFGKTGTAEFGSGKTLKNHAWFVGWQGDTAFAVFVDVGASGGQTAAPIAAKFLRTLAAS